MDQPAHGACSLIKTKTLKEIGGYDEQFNCQDGVDLWFKIIGNYKVKNVNLPLFYYRQHNKSLTKNVENIYKTRDKILNKHTQNKKNFNNILAIIPVRGENYGETLVALKKINKTPIIHKLIIELQKIPNIKKILVSTPDQKILCNVNKRFKKSVITHKREEKFARLNTSINQTLISSIKKVRTKKFKPDLILVVNVVCPFLNYKNFEAAINLIKIFNTDEIIAVKKENDNFFYHNGKGLKRFQNSNRLSLEREQIFREIGGMRLIKTQRVGKNQNTVGHIFLDDKSSFIIKSNEDLLLADIMSKIN
jgi:CMP-N-acetylneuraminic acid synthetase|tara:strand:- start:449 stop:1369 length:921 start_codon:yes stop_codon:yes gene_type:complete